MYWRLRAARLALALSAMCLANAASVAMAQFGGGGVEVDADGVLRTKFVRDPAGRSFEARVAAARASLDRDLARPSPMRMVSLTRLEKAVAQRIARGAGPTDEMKFLAGLTGIRYVFCFPESGEIVIAGPAEGYMADPAGRMIGTTTGRSIIELQDLVVALRAFAPGKAGPKSLGVSIDPTKQGLQNMQEFLLRVGGRAVPGDAAALAKGLKDNLGLQTVTIKGVSPKTHFAQVLTEADYRMKLIGIGLERPPVKITSYVERANPAAVARNALQRWYFVPNYEAIRVSADELAMELVGAGIKLIGADEMVTADGGRVTSKAVDRASQAFVQSFTANYAKLAEKSPVYGQLRNLIDMTIAAAFMQHQDYYGRCGWKMEVFGSEEAFPVETYPAPTNVETAVNAVWKGNTLMTPIGGGVSIQPRLALASENVLQDEDGKVEASRARLDLKAVPADRWWWDAP